MEKTIEDIKILLAKYEEEIKKAKKGKIEINFAATRTTISVTVIDEDTCQK